MDAPLLCKFCGRHPRVGYECQDGSILYSSWCGITCRSMARLGSWSKPWAAKFKGYCPRCRQPIAVGEMIVRDRELKKYAHQVCGDG